MKPVLITQQEPPVKFEITEPLVVTKYEPHLEHEIMGNCINDFPDSSYETIIPDIKDIDIVSHTVCEYSIRSEVVPTNILESKYLEVVEAKVFVKTENAAFVKIENTSDSKNLIKTENISNVNVQGVLEVQGNLKTDEQHVLNFSNDLNGNRKHEHESTSWKEVKEKIKVIEAPAIPVEPYEYTSSAKDKYICNHCQHVLHSLYSVKRHIKQMHRKALTMYQCPYCPHKVKVKGNLRSHIIHKHKVTKETQWFQYRYCDKCNYKTLTRKSLNYHKLIHLKPEEIQYFYCHHCSYKSKQKDYLKGYIFRRHFKTVESKQAKATTTPIKQQPKKPMRYHCDQCEYKTYVNQLLKWHNLNHLKPEEIQYVYCYHCSYKSKYKHHLTTHIFNRHFKKAEVKIKRIRYHCDQCDYKTDKYSHLKRHKSIHLKPEESQYFHCYHCSFKSRHKTSIKAHISRHFERGEIEFHCYICDFMTLKRKFIIDHIKKHRKVQIKSEINQL